jgi:alpha-tubulin suppressor-like RCC1 family protein
MLQQRWVASGFNAGHLGVEDPDEARIVTNTSCPALLDLGIIEISSGRNHTLALTDTGQVYSMGCNSHGQLGQGDRRDRYEPTLIKMFTLEKIVQVCASYDYSVVLNGIHNSISNK